MSKLSSVAGLRIVIAATVCVAVVSILIWTLSRSQRRTPAQVAHPVVVAPTPAPALPFGQPIVTSLPPRAQPPDPAVTAAKAKPFDSFQRRPFAAVKKGGANEWTNEDGRSPEVIRRLAHNEFEAERMIGENATIKRRQLVYRNEPITVTIDRARAAGTPVSSFTLPALDGQECEVEVTLNNVQSEKMAGSLSGRIKGRPNSMASIGFVNGNESFNLISPDDGLYIVADAREPGEVMVKEIDPGKYALPAQSNVSDYITAK